MSDSEEKTHNTPSEGQHGQPKKPDDASRSKPDTPADKQEVPSQELDVKKKGSQRLHVPKKTVISIAAVAVVAVVGLAIANAMGAFHEHTWAEATCTQPRHCTQCGATDGEPLGHDYQEKTVAATCTEGGKRVYTCSRCHDTYSEDDGTPATGHNPGGWTVDSASLKMVQKCQTCGETLDSRDLTREDVDQALAGQPITLDSCRKVIQDSTYKALYPDMAAVTVTNHSNKVVRNIDVQMCAWDTNGYPVNCKMAYDFTNDGPTASLRMDDVNLLPNESWDSNAKQQGWQMDFNTSENVSTLKGVIASAEFSDGTTWNNEYADAWLKLYEDKQL